MFSNDKPEKYCVFIFIASHDLTVFHSLFLWYLNCPTFCLFFIIEYDYILIVNEWNTQKIPLVLCDVTGAHAALLLIAAIQLRVLLPVIWDWRGRKKDRKRCFESSLGVSQSKNRSRNFWKPSKSISWMDERRDGNKDEDFIDKIFKLKLLRTLTSSWLNL